MIGVTKTGITNMYKNMMIMNVEYRKRKANICNKKNTKSNRAHL